MSVPRGGASLITHGRPGQGAPRSRPAARLLLALRALTGLVAVGVALRSGLEQAALAERALAWNLPVASIAIWIGIVVLIACGVGLVFGLATRLCALGVLLVALVIVATAGRVDGGLPLIGGALLAVACLVLVARGGGASQLLDRVDPAR